MKRIIFGLLISLITTCSFAQEGDHVYEYTLKNGLKILIKPDHRFPIVISQIWYKVGSSYEHNGITGVSHALEHMMFRGTAKYGPGKFTELITQHGGSQNAFTHQDFTGYYQILPAKDLALSFELEADRMQNLTIDPKLFATEMKAVQEERRLRIEDIPESRLQELLMAAVFVSNPYHHPVIGWKDDLDHMRVTDLKNWYKQWYVPNNATLVIVGDVNPQKTFELAKQYFDEIPSKPLPEVKPQKEIQPLGEKMITVNVPAKVPTLMIGFLVPSLMTAKDPKTAYALLVLSKILSGGESARLEKDLVRQKQMATTATAYYDIFFQRQEGVFVFYGIPAQGYTIQTLKENFLKHIQLLQKDLIDSSELERVKALTIAENVYKKDSAQQQANEIGGLESVGLSYKNLDTYVKQVESITSKDVQEAAKNYLIPERMTVGILNPLPMSSIENKAPTKVPHEIPHH